MLCALVSHQGKLGAASAKVKFPAVRAAGGTETLAIDHPELGDLMAARDLLRTAGYDMDGIGATQVLNHLGVPDTERVFIKRSNVTGCHVSRFPNRGLIFLTRAGRNHVLMASTTPEAKEFRE